MGCHQVDCEWGGKRLRVLTYGGLRARRQLWIDAELADEVSSIPLSFRYPLLCARVELDGQLHDVDVVHERTRAVGSKAPRVTILVDGEVIHGDEHARRRLLIEPKIWGRVRARGFWAYAIAESPRGVLWLVPAIVGVLLLGLELRATIALVGLLSTLAFVALPLSVWLRNERRWRSRELLLGTAKKPALISAKLEPTQLVSSVARR